MGNDWFKDNDWFRDVWLMFVNGSLMMVQVMDHDQLMVD